MSSEYTQLAINPYIYQQVLPCFPAAEDILKPPPQLFSNVLDNNNTTTTNSSQFYNCIYARFGDPVPDCQSSYQDVLTENSSILRIFNPISPQQYNNGDPVNQYIRYQYIRPITKELILKDERLPIEIWSNGDLDDMTYWKQILLKYEALDTHQTYQTAILKNEPDTETWTIPLFGKWHNSLTDKVLLAKIINKKTASEMLMHYISVVCLQFYLMERNRFLQLRTDRHFEYRESENPYIFLIFQKYDIRQSDKRVYDVTDYTYENLCSLAKSIDYVTFFRSVILTINPIIHNILGTSSAVKNNLTREDIEHWCRHKIQSNFLLHLGTSGFNQIRVRNFISSITESMGLACSIRGYYDNRVYEDNIKLFAAPELSDQILIKTDTGTTGTKQFESKIDSNQYNQEEEGGGGSTKFKGVKETDLVLYRVPSFYCHFWFNPVNCLTICSEYNDREFDWPDQKGLEHFTFEQLKTSCKLQDITIAELSKILDDSCIRTLETELNKLFKLWFTVKNAAVLVEQQELLDQAGGTKKLARPRKQKKLNNQLQLHQQNGETQNILSSVMIANLPFGGLVSASIDNNNNNNQRIIPAIVPNSMDLSVNDHYSIPRSIDAANMKRKMMYNAVPAMPPEYCSRPKYKVDIEVNLVRARYAYIIHNSMFYTNVALRFEWNQDQKMDPEYSPLFITDLTWRWLYNSGFREAFPHEIYNKLITSRYQFLDNTCIVYDDDNATDELCIVNNIVYLLDKSINVHSCSFEFKTIERMHQFLLHLQLQCENGYILTKPSTLNLFAVFHGMVLLFKSEQVATYIICHIYTAIITNNTSLLWQYTNDDLSPAQIYNTLLQIQDEYVIFKNHASMSVTKESNKSIKQLINIGKQTWNQSGFCIPSVDQWRSFYDYEWIQNTIFRKLTNTYKPFELYSTNGEEEKQLITDSCLLGNIRLLLIQFLIKTVNGSEQLSELKNHANANFPFHPDLYEFKIYRKPNPEIEEDKNYTYLKMYPFVKECVKCFHFELSKLSVFWRIQFPAQIIANPIGNRWFDLEETWKVAPEAMRTLYKIAHQARDGDLFKEAKDLQEMKRNKLAQGEVMAIPKFASTAYNVILFLMNELESVSLPFSNPTTTTTNTNTNKSRHSWKRLRPVLQELSESTQSKRINIVTMDQQSCLATCRKYLEAQLTFYSNPDWEKVINRLVDHLTDNFQIDEICDRLLDLLEEITSVYKFIVNKFKQECKEIAEKHLHTGLVDTIAIHERLGTVNHKHDIKKLQFLIGKTMIKRAIKEAKLNVNKTTNMVIDNNTNTNKPDPPVLLLN